MNPYFETELGKLYHGDCLEVMPELAAGSVDLTITSPPYDNLREYKGCEWGFDVFKGVAKELYRLTVEGGVIVWVVGDATIDGSETGTSFKQALYFKEIGFNLHDTMIYEKRGGGPPHGNKYTQSFEYMFVFSKGNPRYINLIKDRRNRWGGTTNWGKKTLRENTGELTKRDGITVENYGKRTNIWQINNLYGYATKDEIAYEHPATFPEKLAADHVISWSNESNLILDPFLGSGTVGKVCEKLKRRWIGIEISEEYCEIAANRIAVVANQRDLF